jgi:hypothetical protein
MTDGEWPVLAFGTETHVIEWLRGGAARRAWRISAVVQAEVHVMNPKPYLAESEPS